MPKLAAKINILDLVTLIFVRLIVVDSMIFYPNLTYIII